MNLPLSLHKLFISHSGSRKIITFSWVLHVFSPFIFQNCCWTFVLHLYAAFLPPWPHRYCSLEPVTVVASCLTPIFNFLGVNVFYLLSCLWISCFLFSSFHQLYKVFVRTIFYGVKTVITSGFWGYLFIFTPGSLCCVDSIRGGCPLDSSVTILLIAVTLFLGILFPSLLYQVLCFLGPRFGGTLCSNSLWGVVGGEVVRIAANFVGGWTG